MKIVVYEWRKKKKDYVGSEVASFAEASRRMRGKVFGFSKTEEGDCYFFELHGEAGRAYRSEEERWRYLETLEKKNPTLSLEQFKTADGEMLLPDTEDGSIARTEARLMRPALRRAYGKLSPLQRWLIRETVLSETPRTLAEAAALLNTDRETLEHERASALDSLKHYLEDKNETDC